MTRKKAKAKTFSKKRTSKNAAPTKPVRLKDTTGQFTGGNADWNIDSPPMAEPVSPREDSLRQRALAKMQKGGITADDAAKLCRDFDKERGKRTN